MASASNESRRALASLDLLIEAERFLENCVLHSDALASLQPGDRWRTGVVAFVRSGSAVALVKKSDGGVNDYDFKGLWAMPGGMVRGEAAGVAQDVPDAATLSLAQRMQAEAGLHPKDIADFGYAGKLGPIVSRYTRNGTTRHTLIVVRQFGANDRAKLSPADPSIDEAEWMSDVGWESLAPANRVALAHLLWDGLSEAQKNRAEPSIERAVAQCSEWAQTVDVVRAAAPWDTTTTLNHWRGGFPRA